MLGIEQIEKHYPPHLQPFKRFLLREYLQHQILAIIYQSEYGSQLSFLGGTALRIVYQNQRFSEDLDFDNLGLDASELEQLTKVILRELELEGYEVQMVSTHRNAFRCKIKFPGLLYQNKLSPLKQENILIQFDTEPQRFDHQPESKLLNAFDVLTYINVTPQDILLSQKLYAAFDRKRAKGRDFFDILFLASKTVPNYKYLQQKLQIQTPEDLKSYLIESSKPLNFEELALDVQPFLFRPKDHQKVRLFPQWLEAQTWC